VRHLHDQFVFQALGFHQRRDVVEHDHMPQHLPGRQAHRRRRDVEETPSQFNGSGRGKRIRIPAQPGKIALRGGAAQGIFQQLLGATVAQDDGPAGVLHQYSIANAGQDSLALCGFFQLLEV